jgi:hypothetical protein
MPKLFISIYPELTLGFAQTVMYNSKIWGTLNFSLVKIDLTKNSPFLAVGMAVHGATAKAISLFEKTSQYNDCAAFVHVYAPYIPSSSLPVFAGLGLSYFGTITLKKGYELTQTLYERLKSEKKLSIIELELKNSKIKFSWLDFSDDLLLYPAANPVKRGDWDSFSEISDQYVPGLRDNITSYHGKAGSKPKPYLEKGRQKLDSDITESESVWAAKYMLTFGRDIEGKRIPGHKPVLNINKENQTRLDLMREIRAKVPLNTTGVLDTIEIIPK